MTDSLTGGFDRSLSWTDQRDALLAFVQSNFSVQSDQVIAYLRRNSELAWILVGAKSALEEHFGEAVIADLALVIDPDTELQCEQLFVYIRSGLPEAEALAALDKFDREWLLQHIGNISGRLSLDLRF